MNRPLIIAHRGASGHAPENTKAAFQLALDQHADGIELDVMLSKDGRLVVIHDDTVDRTTNGTGRVRDLTLNQLMALDAGNGEKIPTLEEVLNTFGGRYLINIELKNYATPFDKLPIAVGDLLKTKDYPEKIIISSFNPFNLARFRRRCPQVKQGLLTLSGKAKFWLWRFFKYDALHPYYQDVDEALVADLKASHHQTNVWTVDDPGDIRRMVSLGVDSIITNYPKETREIVELNA